MFFLFPCNLKSFWNHNWFLRILLILIQPWHIFLCFYLFYSSQFCTDIRLQLENDFMKSLQAEVSRMIWLCDCIAAIKLPSLLVIIIIRAVFLLHFILLRSLMVKWRLLDHYLGTLRILLGIQISPACSWGRTKLLRGKSRFVWWFFFFKYNWGV